MKNYKIYCHELKADGRKYFGATSDTLRHRWNNGKGHSYGGRMRKAIKEYGWDAFKHYLVIDGLSEEEAYKKEQELIINFRTQEEEYGFNSSVGGKKSVLGVKRSAEAKEKAAAKNRGKKRTKEFCQRMRELNLGRHTSEETKQKLREINLGKKHSEETRKKISESNKGKVHPMKNKKYDDYAKRNMGAKIGHPTSEETRRKIGIAHSKPVICIETNTVYESAREAERQTGVNFKLISMNCRKKCKSVYGKHWEFYKAE